jgi:hypothetical protein
MTSLVTLSTKDAVVMGCDSLGTVSRPMVDPFTLAQLFDFNTLEPICDSSGKPLVSLSDVVDNIEQIPYNHMTHVDKLISLDPLPMGVMSAGVASIGDRTIKSLLTEFHSEHIEKGRLAKSTVFRVSQDLKTFIKRRYSQQFKKVFKGAWPPIELIVAGFSENDALPQVYKIEFPEGKANKAIASFGLVFGGQSQEIERLVRGTDLMNRLRIQLRYKDLLAAFAKEVKDNNGPKVKIPDVGKFADDKHFFGRANLGDPSATARWSLNGMETVWGDFSDQNAIDCVHFFVEIMIQAQRFNSRMPTVGGEIHIGLITKSTGFQFISKEEYRHGQHAVARRHKGVTK